MNYQPCPICGNDKPKEIANIGVSIFRCRKCNLEYVDAEEMISLCNSANNDLDQNLQYLNALKSIQTLRRANNNKILIFMEKFLPKKSIGLEVGSAVGLFMEQAKAKYVISGIEPMSSSFETAKEKGLDVIKGFFPKDIDFSKQYDFIIFNDVFEHIPNTKCVMESCEKLLKNGGFLLINLPDSSGILHKISSFLYSIGDSSSIKRLWQVGTESPHLYYFNSYSLDLLAEKYRFYRTGFLKLDSFSKEGLSERINAIPVGKLKGFIYNIGLIILYPLLHLMYSDTNLYVYKKKV